MRIIRGTITTATVLVLLTACAGGDSTATKSNNGDDAEADGEPGKIVESGFGQSGQYVTGIAVVKATSKESVGESVTVSANFKDKAGEVVITEEQVEGFWWEGQEIVLPVFVDLGDQETAEIESVDFELSVSDYTPTTKSRAALPKVDADKVAKDEYGGVAAKFTFENPLDKKLTDPRIGVLCRDKAGKIVGGSSVYPSFIAAKGKIVETVGDLIVTGTPKTCTAYPSYDVI